MNEFPVPNGFWELPTCPQIAHQILKLAPLGKETVPELLDVIRWDPAVAARILATANATRFGQSWPVVSLDRARLLLDDLALRLLALQFTLDSLSSERSAFQPAYEMLWRQSRIHAVTAMLLGDESSGQAEVNPFLAGLLIGLPRLALLQFQPETAQSILKAMAQTGRPWSEIEREFLPSSPENLLLQANFPPAFGKALLSKDSEPGSGAPRLAGVLAAAEAMGDLLVFEPENRDLAERWRNRLDMQLRNLQSGESAAAHDLESLVDLVRTRLDEWFPWNDEVDSERRMLAQANRELGRLGLRTAVAHGQAQTRVQQAEQSLQQYERKIFNLERQALRDPLTGVYNRRFLLEALQKEVARCCRYATPIGLLFVDVDNFKPLNDTWGHLVGDVVLRRIADTLGGVLRGADILARYGGEEFVVLPNDPNEAGIVQLAERLRLAVEQLVAKVEGQSVQVTVSVGCTLTVPTRNDLDLGPQLLAAADAAMYDAKQLGRNRVVFRSLLDDMERKLMQLTIDRSFSRWLVLRNILNSQIVENLLLDYSPERLPLGELAIDTGLLTDKQVAKILDLQGENEERFGAVALALNLLTLDELAMLLARQRENPIQLARQLIGKRLLEESQALELVNEYLASLK